MQVGDKVTIQNYHPDYDGLEGLLESVCGVYNMVRLKDGRLFELLMHEVESGEEEEAGEMSMDTLW